MKKAKILNNSDGLGRVWLILIIVLSVLVVGGIGYSIGKNKAESDAKAKYDQQVQSIQKQLDDAKANVSDKVATGQDAVTEGQQTLESLQAQNTQLQATIDQQKAQIADLQKQLDEANSTTPPPTNQ